MEGQPSTHPVVITNKKPDLHDNCYHCGYFAGLYICDLGNLCHECLKLFKTKGWHENTLAIQEERRANRLKNKYANEVRMRHLKGRAPINLRG